MFALLIVLFNRHLLPYIILTGKLRTMKAFQAASKVLAVGALWASSVLADVDPIVIKVSSANSHFDRLTGADTPLGIQVFLQD